MLSPADSKSYEKLVGQLKDEIKSAMDYSGQIDDLVKTAEKLL